MKMLSTMQRLVAENERWRSTGEIDRFILWFCINAVVWVQVYELYKGVLK
jgi:hypothetical protein